MGYGYRGKCPDCGYTLVAFQGTGIGEVEIDTEYRIFECEKCGYYEVLPDKEQHRCIRCRGQMRLIEQFDEKMFGRGIICPHCHGYLEADDILQERECLTQSRFRTKLERTAAIPEIDSAHHIAFGCYPQGPNCEIKPIIWQILKKEQDKMLLISKYGLDNTWFHDVEEATDWEKCYLRSWLNRDFYNTAFTKLQQQQILTSNIAFESSKAPCKHHMIQDRIFLLSLDDAKEMLGYTTSERSSTYVGLEVCEPTDYAFIFRKAWIEKGSIRWWLRSVGTANSRAAYVEWDCPDSAGEDFYEELGVRPAMWVSAPLL